MKLQTYDIVLPTIHPLGTETEAIDDTDEHTSLEFPTEYLNDKVIHLLATEVVAVGTPGVLHYWVELSPVLSTTSTAYWSAIGGGGGAIAPRSPGVIVATGTNLTVHTELLAWRMHSIYARIVVQTPVAASLPTAYWVVQVIIGGKGPA